MFGRWAFSLAGSAAWNTLPDYYLRYPSRFFDSFCHSLKTFLFSSYSALEVLRLFAIIISLLLTLTLTRTVQEQAEDIPVLVPPLL